MKKGTVMLLALGWMAETAFTLHAQNVSFYRNAPKEPKVNLGVKAGFNSTMFFIDRLTVDGHPIEHLQNNYKVGVLGAFFVRFNIRKHHFLQSELSYNLSNGSIAAADKEENTDLLDGNASVKSKSHSIAIPLLYGYKFVDAYPYQMSFFVGPQVAYYWKKHMHNEYSGFFQQGINERRHLFGAAAVLGLAVNITNLFIDFRYEIGLHNLAKSVVYDTVATPSPYNEQELYIKRRKNVLSFSLGVIF